MESRSSWAFGGSTPTPFGSPIGERHINGAGLLSGAVTFALVDYCMGSTLWKQTTDDEGIATVSISINYVQTATEGDVVCTTELDRRNRRLAVLRSEVRSDDGRLLATAIGSYTIYPRKRVQAPDRIPAMPTLEIGDASIYYELHGDGEPLLCVMGLAADTVSPGRSRCPRGRPSIPDGDLRQPRCRPVLLQPRPRYEIEGHGRRRARARR